LNLIGLDFDNTIVSYDALFHQVALERSLIPASLPKSKVVVRDYLRSVDKEDAWTEMQGYVYGARMADAAAYPGATEFMRLARQHGIPLAIVSHKTRYPFLGPRYDLHEAARSWVENKLAAQDLIEVDQVFFELTKDDKIRRVAEIRCDYFIDDLPEILLAPAFPRATAGILFDPESSHTGENASARFESWQDIAAHFEAIWKTGQ
jgi:hypothetical protein